MKLTGKQIKEIIDQEISRIQEADKTVKVSKVDKTVYVDRPEGGDETVKVEEPGDDPELESNSAKKTDPPKKIEKFKFKKPANMYSDPDVRDAVFRRELIDYIQKLKDAGVELTTAGTQNLDRLDPNNPNPTDDPDLVGLETLELTPEEFEDLMKNESTIKIRMSDLETIINEVIAESRGGSLNKVEDPAQRIANILMSGHEKFASILGVHRLDKIGSFNSDVNEYLSRTAAEIVKMAESVKNSSD